MMIKMIMMIKTQATAPYQYLMYMRCLALQLSAINSVSTGDVVIIIIILITVVIIIITVIITVIIILILITIIII